MEQGIRNSTQKNCNAILNHLKVAVSNIIEENNSYSIPILSKKYKDITYYFRVNAIENKFCDIKIVCNVWKKHSDNMNYYVDEIKHWSNLIGSRFLYFFENFDEYYNNGVCNIDENIIVSKLQQVITEEIIVKFFDDNLKDWVNIELEERID